ncbi:hypothetical protein [Dyella sp. C11]|uniref:hypothetical protein n=1 Tax=Dyella sp. C11 TaxID=2126991 RepID=UPI000D652A19|nr:hypothetical protein [Dyella sp. C11]
MKRWFGLLLFALISMSSHAADGKDQGVMVYGKADKDVPGWSILTDLPTGWTQDCCMYAKAIGVNLVLYKGEWTGDPERVMVLNVWPSKLSSLEAELQDDRHHYLARDAAAKVDVLAIDNKNMACRGVHYAGTDHKDDLVVFCDPGLATGVRLSWSMTLAHDDPQQADLIAAFQHVVEQSKYLKYTDETNGKSSKTKANP